MREKSNQKARSDSDFAEEFYEQYKGLMYRLALHLTDNKHNSEDLVQETLSLLLNKLDILRVLEPPQIEAYIVRTMRNIRINERRRSAIIRLVSLDELKTSLQEEDVLCKKNSDGMLTHLEVVLLMEKLSPEDRLLLNGCYLQGLSAEELAKQLGCNPNSIRMKLTRARKHAFHLLKGK